jgi:glycosyltransferase involved in cell wall biosynthesis/GT2 family glycosyltransferase
VTVRVTAVVLSWNSARYLGAALASLRREAQRVPTEIVVVDNGSSDDSLAIAARVAPEARIIRNSANRGVAAARNQGVAASRAEFVLFLDSDAEMTPGSLDAMVRFLEAHPRVAVVGPRLVAPDGEVQYSCRRFPTVPGKLLRLLPFGWRRRIPWVVHEEMLDVAWSGPTPVDHAIGACQLIRRDVLISVGGLDDRMFYGPEDVDFCLRVWRAGSEVYYLPDAVVVHAEQRITRRRLDRLTLRHATALARYFWKHRYVWRRPQVGGRPRLLHLVTVSEWGGAQAYVLALARGLRGQYDVTVGCAPGGPLVPRVRAEGIRTVEIPGLVRPPRPLVDLVTLGGLARWMRRERFTVVHCHSTKAGLLGRFAARIAGVPGILFTVHGWPHTGWWHPILRSAYTLSERWAARISTAVICVSEHDRQKALGMRIAAPDRLAVIHNGIAPARWAQASRPANPSGAGVVVSVARLTDQKDPVTLLRAWKQVPGPHRLRLAGGGPLRPALEAMVRQEGLTGRVDLLGERDDVPQILSGADLFALSSRWEGLPFAIIEAMMSGLAVVATEVDGVPELVVDGETGLLVPPGDPDALAGALARLLSDPVLCRQMGEAGRRRALERFTESRMLEETARLYARVLEAAGR